MFPDLISIGPIVIRSYGVLVALAFIVGYNYAKSLRVLPDRFLESGFLCVVISSIVGARLFYIFLNLKDYISNPIDVIKVWEGGLVFYGGFIFSVIVLIGLIKKYELDFFKVGDVLILSLLLGEVIGRLGCFFAGCCYGKPTDLPWGIVFTHPNTLAPVGIKIHPTQIYESISYFIAFLILNLRFHKRKREEGKILCGGLVVSAVIRYIGEFLRGDTKVLFLGMTLTQYISILIIIWGIWLRLHLTKKHRNV